MADCQEFVDAAETNEAVRQEPHVCRPMRGAVAPCQGGTFL